MKKLLALICLVGIIVSLVSCTKRQEPVIEQPKEPTVQQAEEPKEDDGVIPPIEEQPVVSKEDEYNRIMCIFGGEQEVKYDNDGNEIPTDTVKYITSVISYYYSDEDIFSEQLEEYSYFGWFLMYSLNNEDLIKEHLPNFERFVVVDENQISGEIYGVPADDYETIVTSFYDVSVDKLRAGELYNEQAHAYVPNGGPGIGELPEIKVVDSFEDDDVIVLDISVEGSNVKELTVKKDNTNIFNGIKFVSLINK